MVIAGTSLSTHKATGYAELLPALEEAGRPGPGFSVWRRYTVNVSPGGTPLKFTAWGMQMPSTITPRLKGDPETW